MELLSPIRESSSLPTNAKIVRLKRLSDATQFTPTKSISRSHIRRRTIQFAIPSPVIREAPSFKCDYCEKKFFHRTALLIHIESHDQTLPKTKKVQKSTSLNSIKVNSKSFFEEIQEDLQQEMIRSTLDKVEKNENQKKFKCEKCRKRFRSWRKMIFHNLRRHKKEE
ncbi:Oidioi.mRNA.OKI2018_I69.chr1.g1784.t1.cds [Oikopleura dioica]|uniref:Oidioi.mRNA.OKI2018_I69.chr1.g1784.t1.cds n=1 Tax=Oikopleura dioica TaxID=34765 RepID=A0ABN7SPH8_OIKDI|nr:Oidioi.mRNA.OKI2018_I69.chr1.g1784.t1.cds [Oikopleura dioica]